MKRPNHGNPGGTSRVMAFGLRSFQQASLFSVGTVWPACRQEGDPFGTGERRRRSWLAAWVVVLAGFLLPLSAQEWRPLFNGKDLTGWKVPEPNPFWRVVDGVLVGQSDPARQGNVLWTEKEYADFELEFEARWDGEIDSGVMLRKPELQLQIGVSRTLKKDMTGSFYTGGRERYPESGQAREIEKILKPGQWNKFRLRAQGTTFTVWINDQKVVEYTDDRYKDPAPIGLQIHAGVDMRIEFRNMRIRELPPRQGSSG